MTKVELINEILKLMTYGSRYRFYNELWAKSFNPDVYQWQKREFLAGPIFEEMKLSGLIKVIETGEEHLRSEHTVELTKKGDRVKTEGYKHQEDSNGVVKNTLAFIKQFFIWFTLGGFATFYLMWQIVQSCETSKQEVLTSPDSLKEKPQLKTHEVLDSLKRDSTDNEIPDSLQKGAKPN